MPLPLPERLRLARDHAGMSVDDLAKAIDMDPSTIHKWESEIHQPRASNLRRVAKATGVRNDWLQREEGPMTEPVTPGNRAGAPGGGAPGGGAQGASAATGRRAKTATLKGGLLEGQDDPGRYAGLQEVSSNIIWEMRDGDEVIYAVRVSTLVSKTRSMDVSARVETPAASPPPRAQRGRSAA